MQKQFKIGFATRLLVVFCLLMGSIGVSGWNASFASNVLTIYYKNDAFVNVFIHYQIGNGLWTFVPGDKMEASEFTGYQKKIIQLGTQSTVRAAFNNGANSWDNNSKKDYVFSSGTYTITNGELKSGTPFGVVPTSTTTIVPTKTPTIPATPVTTPTATASAGPATGNILTIYYKKDTFINVNIHYQIGNGSWTKLPGESMENSKFAGYKTKTILMGSENKVTAVFNNGSNAWDNHFWKNYEFAAGVFSLTNGTIQNGLPPGFTPVPTVMPTSTPVATPVKTPTVAPTAIPTSSPTIAPTVTPTIAPTVMPTIAPTVAPTKAPTATPTATPTVTPTKTPISTPIVTPSTAPTATISPSSTPTGPANFVVKGSLLPILRNGHLSTDASAETAISEFPIRIMDQNGASAKQLAIVYTNKNGYFETSIKNDLSVSEQGYDVFLQLIFDDHVLKIYPQPSTLDGDRVAYSWKSMVKSNVQTSSVDFGKLRPAPAGALNIWRWIKLAHNYYSTNASKAVSIPKVDVEWTEQTNSGSFAAGDYIQIEGDPGDEYDPDVILHEYGHFLMQNLSIPPDDSGGMHDLVNPSTDAIAYSEGYAHFLQSAVQNDPKYRDTFSDSDYELTFDAESGIVYENSLPLERGSKYEVSVAKVLWDIFDAAQETRDLVTRPFKELDQVFLIQNQSIKDFYRNWFKQSNFDKTKNVAVWDVFDSENVSNDVTVPTVTITQNGAQFCAKAVDEVGVVKLEWYVDSLKLRTLNNVSTSCLDVSKYLNRTIKVYAYDPEGNKYGTRYRSKAFGMASKKYLGKTTTSGMQKVGLNDVSSNELRIAVDDGQETSYLQAWNEQIENLQKQVEANHQVWYRIHSEYRDSKKMMHEFQVASLADLKIYGLFERSNQKVHLFDPNGKLVLNERGMAAGHAFEVKKAQVGTWKIEVVPIATSEEDVEMSSVSSGIEQSMYYLQVNARPSAPELMIPTDSKQLNLMIRGQMDKRQTLWMQVNGEDLKPYASFTGKIEWNLALKEGSNSLVIWVTSGSNASVKQYFDVFVDSVKPQIFTNTPEIDSEGRIIINGKISKDVAKMMINEQEIHFGKSGRFEKAFYVAPGAYDFEIKAYDFVGNEVQQTVRVIR